MGATGHTSFVLTKKVAFELLSCVEWNNGGRLTCFLPGWILDTIITPITIVVIKIERCSFKYKIV